MYEWHIVAISDFVNDKTCQHKAYLDPKEEWNGWACPYFEKEEVERMRPWLKKLNEALTYDEANDEYTVSTEDYSEDNECFKGIDINNCHLYPIGNGSWVWEMVSKPF